MPTIYMGAVSKRRNSTLQPTLSNSYDCVLKQPTSLDQPTFIIQDPSFNMSLNYAKWDNTYYFVDSIVSVRNNVWEVHCSIDVLATYKTEILASTQYVSYSSLHGHTYLADTRIPVTKDVDATWQEISVPLFDPNGCYILTVVGKNGCVTYAVSQATLVLMIHDLQWWVDDQTSTYTGSITESLKSISESLFNSGAIGNTYTLAVQAIRNCVWTPLKRTSLGGVSSQIYLGNFPCTSNSGGSPLEGDLLPYGLYKDTLSISIPWHYSDWRRTYCEDVYLYLPLVGMIQLSSDSLCKASSISIKMGVTPADGQVAYEIIAGGQVIGTYGGSCAAQIPIGINQAATLGQTASSLFGGISKAVSSAIMTAGAGSRVAGGAGAAAGAIAGAVAGTASALYGAVDTAYSTNLSCIGGVGGGSGGALDLKIVCYTVAHDTVVAPSAMAATMGQPTMKPVQLSALTGYCQCANAHVSAPAMGIELDAIDNLLNSGFYIE